MYHQIDQSFVHLITLGKNMWLPYRQNSSKCCCSLWRLATSEAFLHYVQVRREQQAPPEAVWAAVRLLASAEYPFPIFFMLQVLNITLTRWTSRCEQQKVLCFSTRQSHFADCFGFDLRHPGKIKFVVISDYVLLTSAKTLLTTKGTTSRVHEIGKIPPSCWCLIHRNLHYFCHSGKHTIKHHMIKIMLFFT